VLLLLRLCRQGLPVCRATARRARPPTSRWKGSLRGSWRRSRKTTALRCVSRMRVKNQDHRPWTCDALCSRLYRIPHTGRRSAVAPYSLSLSTGVVFCVGLLLDFVAPLPHRSPCLFLASVGCSCVTYFPGVLCGSETPFSYAAPSPKPRSKVVPPVKKYSPAGSYASIPKVKLVEGFGKGLMEDIKRKAPFLASDITDGFSIKVCKHHRSA